MSKSTSRQLELAGTFAESEQDCDCDELPDDFPCWVCVKTGRREMPQ